MNIYDWAIIDESDETGTIIKSHLCHRVGADFGFTFDEYRSCFLNEHIKLYVWAHRLLSPDKLPTRSITAYVDNIIDNVIGPMDSRPSLKSELEKLECDTSLTRLYYFEHSDFAYSTIPYNDPWDSGCVGLVVCEPKYLHTLNSEAETLSQQLEAFRKLAELTVRAYNAWAHDDVWVCSIPDVNSTDGHIIMGFEDDLGDILKERLGSTHSFTHRLIDSEDELEAAIDELTPRDDTSDDAPLNAFGFLWPRHENGDPVCAGDIFHIDQNGRIFRVGSVRLNATGQARIIDTDHEMACYLDVAADERMPTF